MTMFTITNYLIFGILILAALFLSVAVCENNFVNKKRNHFRWMFYILFVMLGVTGILTSKKYIYPTDTSVFDNTDYHVLEHKGFRADSVFYLARQSPEDYFPDMSLWDSKSGVVRLTIDSIYVSDYCEPLFIERKKSKYRKAGSLSNHRGNVFALANNYVTCDIVTEGLLLTKKNGSTIDTIYQLRIVPRKKECLYISSNSHNQADTSKFRKHINKGYPLTEIVAQSAKFDFSEGLQELLEGTLLVRKEIPIINNLGSESSDKNESDLVVSPGTNLYYADNVSINGKIIDKRSFNYHYSGSTLLYSGIGRTKTDVYDISHDNADKTFDIRFVLPKMQKLREKGGRLFITSSVETILADHKDGGYYYNIFDRENNFNHINGEIRYVSGNALESMQFEIMDVYASDPSKKIQIQANDGKNANEFELCSKGNSKWIFDVKDLRTSNSLKFSHIFIYILLFVFLVGLRILVDTYHNPRTLSVIELAAYVVVLCLCTVRLILGWRVSTFVPIEDITPFVYATMRSSIYTYTCLSLLLPFAFIVITAWKSIRYSDLVSHITHGILSIRETVMDKISRLAHGNKRLNRIADKFEKSANLDIACYFTMALAICFIGAVGKFERLLNIPVPMILYLLFDLWLVKRERIKGVDVLRARVFLASLTFLYLFVKDAGFSVIFFVFLFLLHVVIGTLIDGAFFKSIFGNNRWHRWMRGRNILVCLISLLCICVLLLFLKYEGSIMIWIFNNVLYIVAAAGIICIALSVYLLIKKRLGNRPILCCAGLLLIGILLLLFPGYITDKVNSKAHMKYRAEVQRLSDEQKIDDLMEKCDFKSSDITFIMRSAHNQWFINQYLKAGNSIGKDNTYFKIQPHSNQGSTYPTQTTDLVITRYVLAEHGNKVVLMLMSMFLMLILIYVVEVKIQDSEKRIPLGALLLLFVIAMMVFLSATNRIVFIGQDFPFISLQSLVAIVFPIVLLFIAIRSVVVDRLNGKILTERSDVYMRKWTIFGMMAVFAIMSVLFISPKGKNQKESQFDVSKIIQDVSEKTEALDRSLMKFQLATGANQLPKDSLWKAFTHDAGYSKPWIAAKSDSSESNRFYRSLLDYFDTRQSAKNNPDELLHLRKRSGYWHLAVNKKHFFIPSMLEEELNWHGDLLAAKTERYFSFRNTVSGSEKRMASKENFEINILPRSIQKIVENVSISRFDSSWSDNNEPIVLINSYQSIGSKQFFHIESSESTIKGSSSDHQIATLIKEGDLVMVNTIDRKGDEQEVLRWMYGRDNDNYLAKNIWMNGKQRLFYPLGKESMWSYQFANVVSNTYGQDEMYQDSTLRISIDYDLHKCFYDIMSEQNRTKLLLDASVVQSFRRFETLKYSEMQNKKNYTDFYFDATTKQLRYKKRVTNEIERALNKINNLIAKGDVDMDMEYKISYAIDVTIERKFDFSAVVIDGNGRIRLLFDHSRSRNIDPNNIRYFNKFISDLYKNGDNQSERDIFGNKALQILPSGPGSSFKPIAYTSITSQEKIAWETLDVSTDYREEAKSKPDKTKYNSENTMYDYYGGVNAAELGQPLSIDGNYGHQHNNYLIQSNNLYHSAIILLGMQPHGKVKSVFKTAGSGKMAFPVMMYEGRRVSFDRDVWFPGNDFNLLNGIMNDGLYNNFHLQGDFVRNDNRYTNYFGQTPKFSSLFANASNYKTWAYAETGSQNIHDRGLNPKLRNGFNQMFLGAYPLEVTPLQMATMGMRLATLNSAEHIATLDDNRLTPPEYEFFDVPTWASDEDYFKFYQRQVLWQMRQVPLTGTARALASLSNSLRQKGYYLYAKTGTLNDGRINANRDSRMKHLMVIISNKPLEQVSSIEELQKVKYYVMYLSYIGISKDGFTTAKFKRMIEEVVKSELFIDYMEEN